MSNKFLVAGLLAAAVAVWAPAATAQQASIGAAELTGSVRITSGSGAPISLRDTRYTVVSGDRLSTGADSTAVLRLPGGLGQLALPPQSEAVFRVLDSRIEVDLSVGSLLFSLCQGSELTVAAGDLEARGFSDDDNVVDNLAGSGIVTRLDDGGAAVAVQQGVLAVFQRGQLLGRVSSGEEFTYFGASGSTSLPEIQAVSGIIDSSTQICAPVVAASSGGGLGAVGLASMSSTTWIVGGLALSAGVIAYDEDRARDRRPQSP